MREKERQREHKQREGQREKQLPHKQGAPLRALSHDPGIMTGIMT